MQRRAYLRTVGLAVPGLLLSGWAPARASTTTVHLVIRDRGSRASRSADDSLRKGISLGLADVAKAAAIIGTTLNVQHVRGDQVAWSVASRHMADTERLAAPQAASASDWHPRLLRDGAGQLNARFTRHAGVPMDSAAWRGWMAVRVAFDAALRMLAGEDDLLAQTFDGHKGQPLRFSEDGHLQQPTYRTGPDGRPVVIAPAPSDDVVVEG